MDAPNVFGYRDVIERITRLNWPALDRDALTRAAWAYYFFSVQFREHLETAVRLRPDDANLAHLKREECDTDNLSPWTGVALPGEQMNHDEFMRRTLHLGPMTADAASELMAIGEAYLAQVRQYDPTAKAMSISSYEDGGLEAVFRAILTAPDWDTPLLRAFAHFLEEHIRFDSDPNEGHGALSRHLVPDERVLPFWQAFYRLFVAAVPELES